MDAQQIIDLVTKNIGSIQKQDTTDSKLDSVISLIKSNSGSQGGLGGLISAASGIFGGDKKADISSLVTLALSQLKGKDLSSIDLAGIAQSVLKGNVSASNVITTIINMLKK